MKTNFPFATITLMILVVSIGLTSPVTAQDKNESSQSTDQRTDSQWIQLFNGKDMTGWKPKIRGAEFGENWKNTFRVEDGLLKVRYDQYDEFDNRFGHLFYKDNFSHYVLRLEYRFVGDQVKGGPGWARRNSGAMLHGQDPSTMTKEQKFPVSIEVQLLGGEGNEKRSTLNLCTPGTNVVMDNQLVRRHCTSSSSKTYAGDQWVTCEIEVKGSQVIRHKVDGQVVLEYQKPQLDDRDAEAKKLIKDGNLMLEGGSISLQSESHPLDFRKVELKVLDH
ncbi:MAG: DUF1080 domain-containing protein [Mariniblastus sp.]|nr:DUF1080 domain-containing protein [Mariniblastus sp.]